jgi:hypothetical protein
MTQELTHYYALQLWQDYLRAKAEWEHAHEEYVSCPLPVPYRTRDALNATDERRRALLGQLRATPEHQAAFGWSTNQEPTSAKRSDVLLQDICDKLNSGALKPQVGFPER